MMLQQRILCAGGLLMLALSTVDCALTSKSEPNVARYFSPERVERTPDTRAVSNRGSALSLLLGRVSSGSHLREKIMFRESEYEVGYYEGRRWTEKPETYLRRALSHELFGRRGLRRVTSGIAPTLEVELITFEEVRNPKQLARLEVALVLYDGAQTRLERTIIVEQPAREFPDGDSAYAMVDALSTALTTGARQIADRVIAALQTPLPPEPAADAALDAPR